jgi:CBS domain-containing protein
MIDAASLRARDLMTSKLVAVTADTTVQQVATLMAEADIGMVPVVGDLRRMNVEGVITDRDIVVRHVAPNHRKACKARDHMTTRLDLVEPDESMIQVIRRMRNDQLRRILVVDRGVLIGVIAQADIARRIGPEEPEFVETLVEGISEPPDD